jgi:hypothetical protein
MDLSRPKTRDPEEWLDYAPDHSREMAASVREWFLRWEPDLGEAIKWNLLCFTGRKLVCGLSACKRHLGITFFRGTELPDPAGLLSGPTAHTNILSLRAERLDELNREALRGLLRAAVTLDARTDIPAVPKQKRPPYPVPEFFAAALALKKNQRAAAGFSTLSPSCQREYLVWLTSAKRPETRERRLTETLAALANGRRWAQRHAAGRD